MSKYVKVDDLQEYCNNMEDHSITPNEFQRMNHIEIPDEHGDLYDKKDVIRVLFHAVEDVGPICDWAEIMPILDDIPVVVEASK